MHGQNSEGLVLVRAVSLHESPTFASQRLRPPESQPFAQVKAPKHQVLPSPAEQNVNTSPCTKTSHEPLE